jgi:DNA-binding transcriptional regulator YhcF (GntR family)
VVVSRRGLGVFVMSGARERVYAMRRAEFFEKQLPEVFALMDTLGISMEEVFAQYKLNTK